MNSVRTIATISLIASAVALAACESERSGTGGWGGYDAATKVIATVVQSERLIDEIQAILGPGSGLTGCKELPVFE